MGFELRTPTHLPTTVGYSSVKQSPREIFIGKNNHNDHTDVNNLSNKNVNWINMIWKKVKLKV